MWQLYHDQVSQSSKHGRKALLIRKTNGLVIYLWRSIFAWITSVFFKCLSRNRWRSNFRREVCSDATELLTCTCAALTCCTNG
jgi:hypothetical protein